MTISRYEAFRAIVDAGSLTRAAEKLNVTQSGVSHAIASLEDELGFSLFSRDRNGVALTENGKHLLPYARKVLQADENFRQQVAALKGLEIGNVRIGTFASVSAQWLPGIIKNFQANHPAIDIRLVEGDYDDVKRWLASGAVDFGFVSLPVEKSLDTIVLTKDRMCCVLPPGHPLGRQKRLSLAQLAEEPFIMPVWGRNDEVRRVLAANHIKPNVRYEVAEDAAVIAMVENGLGVSILSEMVLARCFLRHVQLVELTPAVYRVIGVAAPSFAALSPAAKKMLDFVQECIVSPVR